MVTSTVFANNRTQAVRLPKAVALPASVKQVEVRVVGRGRLITPVGDGWDDWFDSLEPMGDDFLADRRQGTAETREPL